jgi:hypothetical protein
MNFQNLLTDRQTKRLVEAIYKLAARGNPLAQTLQADIRGRPLADQRVIIWSRDDD